jgi:hypothetical protein
MDSFSGKTAVVAGRETAHQRMDDIRAGRNPVLAPPV